MRILIHEWVTGGGLAGSALPPSWATEGRAMRRAIAADFQSLETVTLASTLDERFTGDEPHGETIRIGPGEEEAALFHWAQHHDYTILIAPETGGVLRDRAELIERAGGRSLGSLPSAIALTSDKRLLARHLARRGIRTPETLAFDARSGLPREFAYPAVVKPFDGAGALHTYYCKCPDDGAFLHDTPDDLVIQPYCSGRPMSATFLIGPAGTIRLVGVGWQRIEVQEGAFHYRGGCIPAPAGHALGEPLAAARSVAGLWGVVGVDFIRDDVTGETTVIEINPRPTTSYVGLCLLLPPGSIARVWLDLFTRQDPGEDLRAMIVPGARGQVIFFPDGTLANGPGRE